MMIKSNMRLDADGLKTAPAGQAWVIQKLEKVL